MPTKSENPHQTAYKGIDELDLYLGQGMTAEQFTSFFKMRPFDDAFERLITFSHGISYLSGWYHNPVTGEPVEPTERYGLMHSEISEALEADRKGLMDDKLPHRLGVEVELADLLHRVFDFAGRHKLDIAGAYFEKALYNSQREDHRPENRAKQGGKTY